jgi:hypothetical protein
MTEACTHPDLYSTNCNIESHSALSEGVGCVEHTCKDCDAEMHEDCKHEGASRSWEECEGEGHPEDCSVGSCDNCGAIVSHDYGVPELSDTTNVDFFKKMQDSVEEPEEHPETTKSLGWKDSQQFRDIMYNNFYKNKGKD